MNTFNKNIVNEFLKGRFVKRRKYAKNFIKDNELIGLGLTFHLERISTFTRLTAS